MKRTWLDAAIGWVSPSAGLSRARSRHAMTAYYEAGEPSRLRRPRTDRGDANSQTQRGAVNLRTLARDLDQNYDIAGGVLNTLVANTIGTGIRPEPQVMNRDGTPAKEVNDVLVKLWADWIKIPEVTWQLGYYNLQRLIARTLYRDGEVFTQLIVGNLATLDHGTKVPFSLEALEPDFVPYGLDDAAKGVLQGIALNDWGRPRGYYCFKQHPGASSILAMPSASNTDLKFVPSENMVHLKLVRRLHQLRGVSIFAACMNRFDDIKDIDESERVAARVAAAMAAYIKKGEPSQYEAQPDGAAPRLQEWAPGMFFDELREGEDIGTISSNRPNNALIPFRQDQLRAVAADTGTSSSSISKNYDGTYSSQRQELVESRGSYDTMTDLFVDVYAQPVWEHFVDAARAARLIVIPNTVDRDTIYNATHSRPAMPWIDPLKEVQANSQMEDRGYTSRSEIVRSRGRQPDEVLREIKRDRDEETSLGVTLDRTSGKGASQAQPQEAPTDETPPGRTPRAGQ